MPPQAGAALLYVERKDLLEGCRGSLLWPSWPRKDRRAGNAGYRWASDLPPSLLLQTREAPKRTTAAVNRSQTTIRLPIWAAGKGSVGRK